MAEKLFSDFNYLKLDDSSREKLERSVNIAFGMLSNVSEYLCMGCGKLDNVYSVLSNEEAKEAMKNVCAECGNGKVNEMINDVKRVLVGKFKEGTYPPHE